MISNNFKKRLFTSIILLLVFFLTLKFDFILISTFLIFSIFSILEFFELIKKITKKGSYRLLANIFFIFYIFLFSTIFISFSVFDQIKFIFFTLLLACVFSDIGGYIFGKIFKGPKLTKISPKKTLSGSLGSLILTSMFMSCTYLFFLNYFSLKIVLISIIISISCQFGDLFFSKLKRMAKIEDTGNFLPGHGGVLDRIDGILLGVPVGFLTLIIIF